METINQRLYIRFPIIFLILKINFMSSQNFGQQLLHTERRSQNPTVQRLKEEVAQIIDELYEQEEQTTDMHVKEWIGKAVVNFKLGFEYAEKAINVQPTQMQEQQTNGNYNYSRKRQPEAV